jgi:hypothetical protein
MMEKKDKSFPQQPIAFFHSPPYSKGAHDSDSLADNGITMFEMRRLCRQDQGPRVIFAPPPPADSSSNRSALLFYVHLRVPTAIIRFSEGSVSATTERLAIA